MAIKSVARLRAIIDRLEKSCDVERLGVITDDCGFYFIDVGECFDDGGRWNEDGLLVDEAGGYWQHGDVEDVELH
jgi:hypothetical protein